MKKKRFESKKELNTESFQNWAAAKVMHRSKHVWKNIWRNQPTKKPTTGYLKAQPADTLSQAKKKPAWKLIKALPLEIVASSWAFNIFFFLSVAA